MSSSGLKSQGKMAVVPALLFVVAGLGASASAFAAVSGKLGRKADLRMSSTPASVLGLPTESESQKKFNEDFNRGNYKQALFSWPAALGDHSFARSSTGFALYSYLLFKNEMRLAALEHLFLIKNPQNLSPEIRRLWSGALAPTDPLWRLARVRRTPQWRQVFASIEHSTDESARRLWSQALSAAVQDRLPLAKKNLAELSSLKQSLFDRDQITMARARLSFQASELNEALKSYESIERSSDYWLESLEERAWTNMRLGRPEQSLNDLKTLLADVFAPQVGPEPFYLQAFINLKICDYNQIFSSLEAFKKRYRSRIVALQKLASQGSTPSSEAVLEKLASTPITWNSAGYQSAELPRYFHRDEQMNDQLHLLQLMKQEEETIASLRSEEGERAWFKGASAPHQAFLRVLQSWPQRKLAGRKVMQRQFQKLAQQELADIHSIVQKMHIIEAEAIQRMTLVDRERLQANRPADKDKKSGSTSEKSLQLASQSSSDQLVFPVKAGEREVWIDELDHYQFSIKGCPRAKARTL